MTIPGCRRGLRVTITGLPRPAIPMGGATRAIPTVADMGKPHRIPTVPLIPMAPRPALRMADRAGLMIPIGLIPIRDPPYGDRPAPGPTGGYGPAESPRYGPAPYGSEPPNTYGDRPAPAPRYGDDAYGPPPSSPGRSAQPTRPPRGANGNGIPSSPDAERGRTRGAVEDDPWASGNENRASDRASGGSWDPKRPSRDRPTPRERTPYPPSDLRVAPEGRRPPAPPNNRYEDEWGDEDEWF
jgi:hypothetical protein